MLRRSPEQRITLTEIRDSPFLNAQVQEMVRIPESSCRCSRTAPNAWYVCWAVPDTLACAGGIRQNYAAVNLTKEEEGPEEKEGASEGSHQ